MLRYLDGFRRRGLARRDYARGTRVGETSGNPWIRKSSRIPGWLHDGEAELLWELAASPVRGHVLEIGTWQGKSACILAGACAERGDGSVVLCVDPFDMSGTERQVAYYAVVHRRTRGTFYEFCHHAAREGFADHVVPLAAPSVRVGSLLQATTLRMAFIDGRHDYDGVSADIALVKPLIAQGGVVAFHDVSDRYPGIAHAIRDRLLSDGGFVPWRRRHCLEAYLRSDG